MLLVIAVYNLNGVYIYFKKKKGLTAKSRFKVVVRQVKTLIKKIYRNLLEKAQRQFESANEEEKITVGQQRIELALTAS